MVSSILLFHFITPVVGHLIVQLETDTEWIYMVVLNFGTLLLIGPITKEELNWTAQEKLYVYFKCKTNLLQKGHKNKYSFCIFVALLIIPTFISIDNNTFVYIRNVNKYNFRYTWVKQKLFLKIFWKETWVFFGKCSYRWSTWKKWHHLKTQFQITFKLWTAATKNRVTNDATLRRCHTVAYGTSVWVAYKNSYNILHTHNKPSKIQNCAYTYRIEPI